MPADFVFCDTKSLYQGLSALFKLFRMTTCLEKREGRRRRGRENTFKGIPRRKVILRLKRGQDRWRGGGEIDR